MTDVPTLLAGIKTRALIAGSASVAFNGDSLDQDYIRALETSHEDVPRLVAALEAVAEMHPSTSIYECDEDGFAQTEDEGKFVRDICGTCSDSSVTENLDDGNYDLAGEWGEVSWPCPTITAVVAALGEDQ